MQAGAASQERLNAVESLAEEVTHEELVSAVMSDLVDHKLHNTHGLVVNEDPKPESKEKETHQ
eukprot:3126754-Amphidinium_carterae.1